MNHLSQSLRTSSVKQQTKTNKRTKSNNDFKTTQMNTRPREEFLDNMQKEETKRASYARSAAAGGAGSSAGGGAGGSAGGGRRARKLPSAISFATVQTMLPPNSFIFEDKDANSWRIFYHIAGTTTRRTHRSSWLQHTDNESFRDLLSFGWTQHLMAEPTAKCPWSDVDTNWGKKRLG